MPFLRIDMAATVIARQLAVSAIEECGGVAIVS